MALRDTALADRASLAAQSAAHADATARADALTAQLEVRQWPLRHGPAVDVLMHVGVCVFRRGRWRRMAHSANA